MLYGRCRNEFGNLTFLGLLLSRWLKKNIQSNKYREEMHMISYQQQANTYISRHGNQKQDVSTISVFVVEDHAIVREGLHALLASDPRIEVIGETGNGRDAVRMVGSLAPDLILTDLSLPGMNGIEAIREIKNRCPDVRIIVLTVHRTEEYIRAALEAGANGYVLKESTHAELMIAVRTVMDGKSYLSPGVAEKIIVGYLNGSDVDARSPWEALTARERVVLKLIAEGQPNKKIALYLSISVKTVEKHRANIMRKLNLHNAALLTAYAIERQLVAG